MHPSKQRASEVYQEVQKEPDTARGRDGKFWQPFLSRGEFSALAPTPRGGTEPAGSRSAERVSWPAASRWPARPIPVFQPFAAAKCLPSAPRQPHGDAEKARRRVGTELPCRRNH